jgi:hypothetical protein
MRKRKTKDRMRRVYVEIDMEKKREAFAEGD